MRKIISLVITLVCSLCIVGCGSSKEEKQAVTGDKVKDAIIKVCKDTLRTDFVGVEINDNLSGEPGSKGTKVVLVTGKIRDGSSNEKIRTANVIRAQELFGALYTSGQPISKAVYFVEQFYKSSEQFKNADTLHRSYLLVGITTPCKVVKVNGADALFCSYDTQLADNPFVNNYIYIFFNKKKVYKLSIFIRSTEHNLWTAEGRNVLNVVQTVQPIDKK